MITERKVRNDGLLKPNQQYQICKTFSIILKNHKTKHNSTRSNGSSSSTSLSSSLSQSTTTNTSSSNTNEQTSNISYYREFLNEILQKDTSQVPSFKIPFAQLKFKNKNTRIQCIAKLVLASCIDKEECREKQKQYIQKNKNLAVDVMNFLDGMKVWIEKKIVLKLDEYKNIPMEPVENDLIDHSQGYAIAKKLLNNASRRGYEEIRKAILNQILND